MATPSLQGNGILYVAGGATVHYIVLSVVREVLHISIYCFNILVRLFGFIYIFYKIHVLKK